MKPRAATVRDRAELDAMRGLLAFLFPGWAPPLDAQRLREVLAAREVRLFRGFHRGQVVASVTLYCVPLLSRRLAVIEEVVTHPAHRRRGWARRLLLQAIDAAARWGADCVELTAPAAAAEPRRKLEGGAAEPRRKLEGGAALRLYRSLGFRPRNAQCALRLTLSSDARSSRPASPPAKSARRATGRTTTRKSGIRAKR